MLPLPRIGAPICPTESNDGRVVVGTEMEPIP